MTSRTKRAFRWFLVTGLLLGATPGHAQTPPSAAEARAYTGLHAAAMKGDAAAASRLLLSGADVNARDDHGRTPLMVAAYRRDRALVRVLVRGGGDLNLMDSHQYDVLTIAAVEDDPAMVKLAIELGADATLITSPYEGTALIAAAHLGHVEVCRELIKGGAPLDHVNNLDWTALIESVVLGDGGARHVATLQALIDAGANVNIPDGNGATPLALARRAGYGAMVSALKRAGAKD